MDPMGASCPWGLLYGGSEMAKYTRTDCPLYGGEYCKKLNMKSCRTCTVTNDNAAGIKADKFDNREAAESYMATLRSNPKYKDAWLFISR